MKVTAPVYTPEKPSDYCGHYPPASVPRHTGKSGLIRERRAEKCRRYPTIQEPIPPKGALPQRSNRDFSSAATAYGREEIGGGARDIDAGDKWNGKRAAAASKAARDPHARVTSPLTPRLSCPGGPRPGGELNAARALAGSIRV